MKAHGLQQTQLAEVLEVSLDRVKSLTSGKAKNLKLEEIERLVGKLGVRAQWLVTGEGPMQEDDETDGAFEERMQATRRMAALVQALPLADLDKGRLSALMTGEPAQDGPLLARALQQQVRGLDFVTGEAVPPANSGGPALDWSRYIQVPHYDVRASAGHGAVVSEENVVDHLVFKRDWLVRSLGLDPQQLALIDVRGDSMSPTINDGDLILLDTRQGDHTTEGIYAINLDGRLLVKRLRLRLSGAIEVISDNERYGTETIDSEQLAQLHVIGRVVWQGRRI